MKLNFEIENLFLKNLIFRYLNLALQNFNSKIEIFEFLIYISMNISSIN